MSPAVPRPHATARLAAVAATIVASLSCAGGDAPGTADAATPALVHLVDLLPDADVASGEAPAAAREERRWELADADAGWRALSPDDHPWLSPASLARTGDGARLTILPSRTPGGPLWVAGMGVDLEGLAASDWETVLVRARSHDRFAGVTLAANLGAGGAFPSPRRFFASPDLTPPIFSDGSVQTYAIPLRAAFPEEPAEGGSDDDDGGAATLTLGRLALLFGAPAPSSVEVLSVALVPRGAAYLDASGVRSVVREGTTRQTLFAHAPARLAFPLTVPPGGRLDLALAVAPGDAVTYRVGVEDDAAGAATRETFLEELVTEGETWRRRSVDLARLAGRRVRLVLEAEAENDGQQGGAVALWGSPIVSGTARDEDERPNVVFYVVDGGDANLMSVYGYDRETTPFLAELAAEGTLFTRAHANATWTQPSTVSFMTSLHHSVLGGLRRGVHSTPVPVGAVTMAERFRSAGYLTAAFTSNPNAGRLIGLERGVDVLRDVETEHHSTSSFELEERFWELRRDVPGGPYWVHFQTTDVHEPNEPPAPFAGRFVGEAERAELGEWEGRVWGVAAGSFGRTSIADFYERGLAAAGVPRHDFYDRRRGLYDETMLHQDHALAGFVERLKASGEWERTILVVAADHGHPAGTFARFGRGLIEPPPEPWQGALFDAYATRVPLLVIWPGHVAAGRRVDTPVSMVDVFPTLLELAGLEPLTVTQGRSLAPLLRGEDVEPRPVVLDEFRVDEATGEMIGNLEVIDGRWGASLEIGPTPDGADPSRGRHAVPAGGRWGAVHPFYPDVPRLLLYDLAADPFATRAVNDQHPDLVRRYHRLLMDHWRAHQALAQQFGDAADVPLTPEQLEQLRALGYIR